MNKKMWPTPVASDCKGSVSEKTWGGVLPKAEGETHEYA